MKLLYRSSVLLLILCMLLGNAALGDTIRLKNGSVIKGKVVAFNQQEFTVVLDLGTSSKRSATKMTIAAEDIDSIEFDQTEASTQSSQPVTSNQTSSQPGGGKYGEMQRDSQTVRATTPPDSTTEPENNPPPTQNSSAAENSSGSGPIEKTVSVSASLDWTSTEIRVQRGQRISITATGEIDLGNGQRVQPNGSSGVPDNRKLMMNKPTGALIAVVGDDNDDFIYIGRAGEFMAAHNGILFLSVNEGNLKDNAGSFLAKVKITSR